MKKLIYIGLAAIFAFATLSCKKAANSEQQPSFKESDLFGFWVHSMTTIGNNYENNTASISFIYFENHSGLIFKVAFKNPNSITWHIEGTTLTLDEDTVGPWPEITLKTLDGKHLVFTIESKDQRSSYLNPERILPGTWKISWPGRWYIVDINKDGSSSWKMNGTTNAGEYNWEMGATLGQAFLTFRGEKWNETLYLTSIQEDKIVTLTSDNVEVILERVKE